MTDNPQEATRERRGFTRQPYGYSGKTLHIEVGGMRVRRGPFWLPDGLHLWYGDRGVHLYWHRGVGDPRRVIFDRLEPSR